jgi:hypothetical protein
MKEKNNKNTEQFNNDIKNVTDGYTNSMQEMWDEYVTYMNGVKKVCQDTPIKLKKQNKKDSAKYKLCDIYEETKEWAEWSAKVSDVVINVPINTVSILCRATGESASYAIEIVEKGTDYATNWLVKKLSDISFDNNSNKKSNKKSYNNRWIKKIIKKIKIITLYVKKTLLDGKLYMYKQLKKTLEFAANSKITSALQTAFDAILRFLNKAADIIDKILSVIEKLLDSIVGFTLDGGIMGFFITPKTIASGILAPANNLDMKPINVNQDIFSNIADSLITPIEEGVRQASIAITSGKNAAMIAEVTKNAATLAGDEIIDIPDSNISLEQSFDLSQLKNLIALAISLLCAPEALPKYERLHPGNIGFLLWLITSFEPTMKKCFGIPTYP